MKIKITRGRFGWQKPGSGTITVIRPGDEPIDVPAATAERLINSGVAEAVKPKAQPKAQPKAEPKADAPAYSEEMTRSELNALASKAGIKGAAKMPNKAAVIAALDKRYGRV